MVRRADRVAGRVAMTALMAAAMMGVGCQSTTLQKFNLTVQLNDAAVQRGATTEVDVIAVSNTAALDAKDMSDYWTRGDRFRQDLLDSGEVWSFTLSPAEPSQTLPANSEFWTKSWSNDEHLFILADIPGVRARDGFDARRIKRSRKSEFGDSRNLTATISDARISLEPDASTGAK